MNYLELLKSLILRAGMGGDYRTLTDVTNLIPRHELARQWIDSSYQEIAAEWVDWTWKSANIDYGIPPNVEILGPDNGDWHTDVRGFKENTAYIRASNIRHKITEETWEAYRHRLGTQHGQISDAYPVRYAVEPNGRIHFHPVSSKAFILNIEAFLQVLPMVAKDDEPLIPIEHRHIIIYKAMTHYFEYEESWKQQEKAEERYQKALAALEGDTLPEGSRTKLSSDNAPLEMVTV